MQIRKGKIVVLSAYIDRFLLPKEHVLESLRDAVINGDEETAAKMSEEIISLGADGWTETANEAVTRAQDLLQVKG